MGDACYSSRGIDRPSLPIGFDAVNSSNYEDKGILTSANCQAVNIHPSQFLETIKKFYAPVGNYSFCQCHKYSIHGSQFKMHNYRRQKQFVLSGAARATVAVSMYVSIVIFY